MKYYEIKQKVDEKLIGYKTVMFFMMIVFCLLSLLCVIVSDMLEFSGIISVFLSILSLIIIRGLSYGIEKSYIKRKNGEHVTVCSFVKDGLVDLKRSWEVTFALLPKFSIIILYSGVILLGVFLIEKLFR